MHRLFKVAMAAAILFPSVSFAAGYEYPDNTARALARGAAYVASGDDPALIQYNPAGLANVSGFRLSLNTHFVQWNTEYQRLAEVDGEFTAIDPRSGVEMQPVNNLNNPWFAPFISASYQIMDGLTVGVGLFGPSAFGERSYTDPRDVAPFFWDGEYEEEEETTAQVQEDIPALAPQRFALIRQATRVVFPSLAVAYEPTPWLRVGATGQLIHASTEFSLAFQSSTVAAALAGQGPESEIIGELDVATPGWGFTGILGAQVMPIDHLTVGVAVRPGFRLRQEGELTLIFNDMQVHNLGLEQDRNGATFETIFPTIVRVGAAWEQDGWLVEVGGNYEHLSVVDAFRLTPDLSIESSVLGTTIEIPEEELRIEKQWRNTFSIRLGGGADLQQVAGLPFPMEAYAGFVYERSAIPTATQNLDFIAPNRYQATTGLSFPIGPVRATAAYSRIFEPTVRVRDSIVPLIDDAALGLGDVDPTIVGNGDYRSQHDIFVFALEGRFGGAW